MLDLEKSDSYNVLNTISTMSSSSKSPFKTISDNMEDYPRNLLLFIKRVLIDNSNGKADKRRPTKAANKNPSARAENNSPMDLSAVLADLLTPSVPKHECQGSD